MGENMVKIAVYPPNSLILADLLERRGHTPLVLQKQIRQKIKDPEIDSPPMIYKNKLDKRLKIRRLILHQ